MPEQHRKRHDSRKRNPFFASPLATVLTCMLAFLAVGLFIKCGVDLIDKLPDRPGTTISSTPSETENEDPGAK